MDDPVGRHISFRKATSSTSVINLREVVHHGYRLLET